MIVRERLSAWSKIDKAITHTTFRTTMLILVSSSSKVNPSFSRIEANSFNSLCLIDLNSKRWTRERMVAGILCNSVVARIKTTFSVGSSKVFKRALKAPVEHVHFVDNIDLVKSHDVAYYLSRIHESHQQLLFGSGHHSITSLRLPCNITTNIAGDYLSVALHQQLDRTVHSLWQRFLPHWFCSLAPRPERGHGWFSRLYLWSGARKRTKTRCA